MSAVRNFFSTIWEDLKNKNLLPIKLLFFLLFGGSMSMGPFMTLYMRSLGITKEELAFIFSFTPILGLLVPPLSGMLADRVGNFKAFLSFMMIAAGLSGTLFLVVPQARITHSLPEVLPFNATCSSGDASPEMFLEPPHVCNLQNDTSKVLVTLEYCQPCGTPARETCLENSDSKECSQMPLSLGNESYTASVFGMSDEDDIEKRNLNFLKAYSFSCPKLLVKGSATSKAAPTPREWEYAPLSDSPCVVCRLTANRTTLCQNTETIEAINPSATFAIYLLVRFIHVTLISVCLTMFSGAVMAVLVEKGGDYGLQRLYTNFGGIIFTPLSGLLIDYISSLSGKEDFRSAFYMFMGIMFICSFMNQFVDLDFKKPNVNILRDCKILLKNPEIDIFLFFMVISGMCTGILETFLFWFLDDLGANKSLMGLTVTVGLLAGIPILAISGWIVDRWGHVVTIIFSFFVLFVRLVGYSLIYNPWQVMPFEALECFSASLLTAVSATYAALLSGSDTVVTLQGLQQGLHYGVGNGLGSLVAGFLLEPLGTRWTFRLTGFAFLGFSLLYLVLYVLFLRKNYLRRLEEENAKKTDEESKNEMKEKSQSKDKEASDKKV